MSTLIGSTVGQIVTPVGHDGTNFRPLLVDAQGRIIALAGHDGSVYRVLKTNASGQVEVLVAGTVPDADKLDGYHAADFVKIAGDTMTGALFLSGAPTQNLHAATKLYVDGAAISPGTLLKHVWSPLAPPASANAKDDEFSDSSWNSVLWSEWDQPGKLTLSEDSIGAVFTCAEQADAILTGVYQAVSDADFTCWTRVSLSGIVAGYFRAGLLLGQDLAANPATSDAIALYIKTTASNVTYQVGLWSKFDITSTNYKTITGNYPVHSVYLRIRQSGTSLYYDWSHDGVSWIQLYTHVRPFTPVQVGLMGNDDNTTAATQARFDFFRFLDTAQALATAPSGALIHLWG